MTETVLTLLTGGFGGSLLTLGVNFIRNRLQRMECHYLEDDVLSKIPQIREDNTIHQNVYCQRFKIINTTNKDITEFKILFQFDATAEIIECYSSSKEGYNKQKVRRSRDDKNQAEALVRNFNRGDFVEYTFQVANITENKYYVTECNCVGFKITCKDKRKVTNRSKSNKSDQILVLKH